MCGRRAEIKWSVCIWKFKTNFIIIIIINQTFFGSVMLRIY